MAKLPFGGHDAKPASLDSWGFLEEIAKSIENGERIRPQLARWLGEAIVHAKRDSNKLLIALALKTPRGGLAMNPNNWLIYGKKLYDLESGGMKAESAIAKILEESAYKDGREPPFSRTSLQDWRNDYAAAIAVHRAIE